MRLDARRNRERVLLAAREVFAEKQHDASMDDVARRAGVGIGTLFRNFPKRIDLVRALYEEDLQQLGPLAAELAITHKPWEGLVEWLQAFVAFSQANRAIICELSQPSERDPEFDRRAREQIDDAVGNVLDRALAARAVDPDLTPGDLVQLIGGIVLSIAADETRNDYLLNLMLRGIRTPRE
ncbi:TetR/AcrR family transcriptional regulator [Pseudothauera nasutitermitis]|uniref:TetR/AcrR family transcriptional regulator n=3 Tax=Betaproteobacteria TaxID=28216 RepID=A0A3M6QUX3_9BURK|nr:TetR/AcrR family transcriptional regulator [Pseudothauera nasutitermitis]RMX06817.1 TetR/AcrR family transcriptional regulator [Corticibacter populi]RZS31594.1 TetR family transcriptional regulator [Corticibacter populi]THF64823.1 TetR/AcrR family transcriptional regulator [Pseudothauera nasutitermitis]